MKASRKSGVAGTIPFNNAAERALRGLALGWKSWMFAGSERGAERAALVYTLIQTARIQRHRSTGLARRRPRPHRQHAADEARRSPSVELAWRAANRISTERPLISRSTSKIASMRLTNAEQYASPQRVRFFSTVELVNALEQEKLQGKPGQIAPGVRSHLGMRIRKFFRV